MSQAIINLHHYEKKITTEKHGGDSKQLINLISLIIAFTTVIWGGWILVSWIKNIHYLPMSRLIVTGYRHYTTNDDIRKAILKLGTPEDFMNLDINTIQQQIKHLPWIKQVSVHKQWPDKLKIHLVEYVSVAYWNDKYLLDKNGKIFRTPAERIENQIMPMLYGLTGNEQYILKEYFTMNKILKADKLQIKTVNMNARHSWQLTLSDDTILKLGRNDKTRRLQRFIKVYPILLQQAINENKRIHYVDLRYDSGLAVGWSAAYLTLK